MLSIVPLRTYSEAIKETSGLMGIERATRPRGTTVRTSDLSETEAIERAKLGDAEAFELLYHLHKRRVYCLCRRMTHNISTAEDLTQAALLRLYRKLHTFRGESAFSLWLHPLTLNEVLMYLSRGP